MALFGRIVSRLDDMRRGGAKEPPGRQFLVQAEELRKAGKLAEAIEMLQEGIKANPSYVAAHVSLGRVHHQHGFVDAAIQDYLSALKLDRENLVAIRQLADAYLAKGEKVEAIKKLKLFRGLKPGDKEVTELIERLDAELNPPRPRPGPRVETWPSIAALGAGHPALGERRPVPGASLPVPPSLPDTTKPIASQAAASKRREDFTTGEIEPRPPSVPSAVTPPAGADESHGEVDNAQAVAEGPAPLEEPFEETFGSEVASREAVAQAEAPSARPPSEVFELTFDGHTAKRSTWETAPPPEPNPLVLARDADGVTAPLQKPVEPELPEEVPILSAPPVEDEDQEEAEAERIGTPKPPGVPGVTETLADLYREQGHVGVARDAYERLAEAESRPERVHELLAKARALSLGGPEPPATVSSLGEWAARFPERKDVRIEDMGDVLRGLVARAGGVRGAALTDLEGLPVVAAGEGFGSPTMEVLIAELTAFWKSVQRTKGELGAGPLKCLTLHAHGGTALVSSVSDDYSLILHVDMGAPLGRVRYEVGRAAGKLRPALG